MCHRLVWTRMENVRYPRSHMCNVARGGQEVLTTRESSRLGLDKIMGYFENTRFPRLADSGTSADTVDA